MQPTTTTVGTSSVAAFRDTHVQPGLELPRWLMIVGGSALALGLVDAVSHRGESEAVRVLRATLVSSGAAYAVTVVLDSYEHFRLEKQLTGHWLRWRAVPLSESVLHAGVLASLFAAILTARRPRGRRRRDRVMLVLPAAFLAIGWLDELVYHRRRVPLREEIIHATEHIAEGMMWTSLYALRMMKH